MELTSLDQVNNQYRQIYLQPHFDDAALSCGGAIALQTATGNRVLVVTVFGGVPQQGTRPSQFALQVQQKMGLGIDPAEAARARRAEDAAALATLGADVLHLDYLDAVYRGNPAYYQSDEALFGTVSAADHPLDEQLAGVFLQLHERAPLAIIYAPLGVGHHVDHQLVCSAADRLAQRKINVKFYEDFPYVARPGALKTRQDALGIPMEPELVEISGTVRRKEEAISLYRSQVPQLFGSEENMVREVESYASSHRRAYPGIMIERYWQL